MPQGLLTQQHNYSRNKTVNQTNVCLILVDIGANRVDISKSDDVEPSKFNFGPAIAELNTFNSKSIKN